MSFFKKNCVSSKIYKNELAVNVFSNTQLYNPLLSKNILSFVIDLNKTLIKITRKKTNKTIENI